MGFKKEARCPRIEIGECLKNTLPAVLKLLKRKWLEEETKRNNQCEPKQRIFYVGSLFSKKIFPPAFSKERKRKKGNKKRTL